MIDTRFIEAKRRAAKTTGDGHRRRHVQRGGERTAGPSVSPPEKFVKNPPPDENIDASQNTSPKGGNIVPAISPQTRPVKPTESVSILKKGEHDERTSTNAIKPPTPMESLENATSNLSIREDMPPPKQGRQRGRNRGRPNTSKNKSPQRNFHGRTSPEDSRPSAHRLSTGSRNDAGISLKSSDTSRKGVFPITTQVQPSPKTESTLPTVRLPEITAPPISEGSRDTMNVIRSEDTNFQSDISRGAVQEGRLYNYKPIEKPMPTKPREKQKPEASPQEEKSVQPQRGVLRIQPGSPEQQKQAQQPSGHRGGLLFIDTNAIKPTGRNNKATKSRGNQANSEFNRNVVLLRKEPDSQPPEIWNPDSISPQTSASTMSRGGPQYKLTPDDILREVKSAYQEIQNLERKVKLIYDAHDDNLEMPRLQRRAAADEASWSAYSKTHRELLEFYHTFFILTQHPSASSNVRRLPKRYNVLARYWKFGIVQFLEFLRQKLPSTEAHMHSFIFDAYSLTSVLLQDVPVFQNAWMECLGDLSRYLYGIEENDDETKEHWRVTATEWYLKTSDVSNDMEGRLFHHLGILSKYNPLLQLNYFAKSLTVVHAFSSARESFLIMMDSVLGKTYESWPENFVKLHGMLFTRLKLDSFDDELDVFYSTWGEPLPTSMQWARLAVIGIAALYQYNRKDSLLKEALRQGRREKREAEQEEPAPTEDLVDGDTILPPSQISDNLQTDMTNVDRAPDKFENIPTDIRSEDHEDISLSKIVFEKSCSYAFGLLSEAANSGVSDNGAMAYVHIWLVFLTYALRYQPVVRLLDRKIPWHDIAEVLSDVNEDLQHNSNELNVALPEELPGPFLFEDSVMRGFEWSRKLFPKDWFQNFDPVSEEDQDTEESSMRRKRRMLYLGIQITRICDCLEFSESELSFRMSDTVKDRIAAAEAKEAEEARRLEEAAQAAKDAAMSESLAEEAQIQPESDEDVDVPGESDEIRALKARRRELKAQLRAQRPESKNDVSDKQSKDDKTTRKALNAGYTILVFDTNLLVSCLDFFKQVVETGEWRVVVPLIVVTELDGLKVNPAPLGPAAAEAINFIEQALQARKLRVITQQGNSLLNLTLRSQLLSSKDAEDGVSNIDSFIIQAVKDQAERHSGKLPTAEKAVLVTGDRSMRVIANAKGVAALTEGDLRKAIFKKSEKPRQGHSKKKSKG